MREENMSEEQTNRAKVVSVESLIQALEDRFECQTGPQLMGYVMDQGVAVGAEDHVNVKPYVKYVFAKNNVDRESAERELSSLVYSHFQKIPEKSKLIWRSKPELVCYAQQSGTDLADYVLTMRVGIPELDKTYDEIGGSNGSV